MQRLRESLAVRWIALLLFTTFTGACASWQPVEGSDVPDRVRVITTARDTVELEEARVHGDSILVGLDPQADATRAMPLDSVSRIETRQLSERDEGLIASGALVVALVVVPLLSGDFWEW